MFQLEFIDTADSVAVARSHSLVEQTSQRPENNHVTPDSRSITYTDTNRGRSDHEIIDILTTTYLHYWNWKIPSVEEKYYF